MFVNQVMHLYYWWDVDVYYQLWAAVRALKTKEKEQEIFF